MKKLFAGFKPVDYESWLAQIKKDLKDKPLEALISNPEKDLEIRAWHHPDKDRYAGAANTAANRPGTASAEWKVRKTYSPGANAEILNDLNQGIDAVGLVAENPTQFENDTQGILFEHIRADIRFETVQAATGIKTAGGTALNFDIIASNAKRGEWQFSFDDFFHFFQAHPENRTLWVEGAIYGDAGSTSIQELAFTLAHLNEYLQGLTDRKIAVKNWIEKVCIELSVTENYFVNIAKFRALRELTALLFSGYEPGSSLPSPLVYARTGIRSVAENDEHNNLLRSTTQAMSALLGGCDVLTINSLRPSELNDRMAKNIQLILREESYFDKVVDPAAGSYYLEALTDQLMEKAWQLFLEVENNGGLIVCLKNNLIQDRIDENCNHLADQLNTGKKTLLGVNKFQSKLESWKDIKTPQNNGSTSFRKLVTFSLESHYNQKTAVS